MALTVAALVPLPTSGSDHDSIYTGDIDFHHRPANYSCAAVLTDWRVVLTVGGLGGADLVLLYVQEGISARPIAIASHGRNVVWVDKGTSDGCRPNTMVVGILVSGPVAYDLTFTEPWEPLPAPLPRV